METSAREVLERSRPAYVTGGHRLGRAHPDANDTSSAIEHRVDLGALRAPEMENLGQVWLPAGLLLQLHHYEVLEQSAPEQGIRGQSDLGRLAECAGQPRVDEGELRRLRDAVAEIGSPGGHDTDEVRGLQERHVALERRILEDGISTHVREVQQPGHTAREHQEEVRHRRELFDVGQISDVARQHRRGVRREPAAAALAGTPNGFWESAAQHSANDVGAAGRGRWFRQGVGEDGINEGLCPACDLTLRQRKEGEHLHAPDQRICDPGHRQHVRRTREQEAPGPSPTVHCGLDGEEQLGHPLDLVDHGERVERREESCWIALRGGKGRRIIECDVSGRGHERPCQRRLARLARTDEQRNWRVAQRRRDGSAQMPGQHGWILPTYWVIFTHMGSVRRLARAAWMLLVLGAAPAAALNGPELDYTLECAGCHRADGSGTPGSVPALRDSVARFLAVRGGRDYLARVPGVAQAPLDDGALAAVLNWMLDHFDRAHVPAGFTPYGADEIGRLRKLPLLDVEAERKRLLAAVPKDSAP